VKNRLGGPYEQNKVRKEDEKVYILKAEQDGIRIYFLNAFF
jgi:hypothetical protein